MRSRKDLIAVILGLAGLFMLATGITDIRYAFKTRQVSVNREHPGRTRVIGALILVAGVLLTRYRERG